MLVRIFVSSWKHSKSNLVLLITAGLLFYYTFMNEIEHLNSFAYTDSMPLIQKAAHPDTTTVHEKEEMDEVDLSKLDVIVAKNKYFPMLFETADQSLKYGDNLPWKASYKSFHPIYEKKSISPYKQISKKYPSLNRISTFNSNKMVRAEILHRWQDKVRETTEDYSSMGIIDVSTIFSTESLIGTLDVQMALPAKIEYPNPMIQAEWSSDIIGGLLAAIDAFVGESRVALIEVIEKIADDLLRSFDTPNSLPQVPFLWQSPIRNRYAYRRMNISSLSDGILEFLELSHISNDPSYEVAVSKILQIVTKSSTIFDIDFLLPSIVDASGCKPLLEEQVSKGEHLMESNVLKSIFEGKFLHCVVQETLLPCHPIENNVNEISLDTIKLYLTILKAYHLNNGNLDNKKNFPITSMLMNSILKVKEHLLFEPWMPDSTSFLLPTSIRVRSRFEALQDENEVEISKDFKVTPEGIKIASLFSLSSVLLGDESLIEKSAVITRSYYELFRRFEGVPDEIILDEKYEHGPFDASIKLQLIKDGFYEPHKLPQGVNLREGTQTNAKNYLLIKDPLLIPSINDVSEENLEWAHYDFPFYVNKLKASTKPPFDLIESLIYLYKITENYEWKLIGEDILGRIQWENLTIGDCGKLTRLFYALFEDSASIDDFIINNEYHFMRRAYEINPDFSKEYPNFENLKTEKL